MLLRSNGTAVACGCNWDGQCRIPSLPEGVIHTQISAGNAQTVLLRSDDTAIGCGRRLLVQGLRDLPACMKAWLAEPNFVVQLSIEKGDDTIEATCRNMIGDELASWTVPDKTRGVKRTIEEVLELGGCAPAPNRRSRRLGVVFAGRMVPHPTTWCEL